MKATTRTYISGPSCREHGTIIVPVTVGIATHGHSWRHGHTRTTVRTLISLISSILPRRPGLVLRTEGRARAIFGTKCARTYQPGVSSVTWKKTHEEDRDRCWLISTVIPMSLWQTITDHWIRRLGAAQHLESALSPSAWDWIMSEKKKPRDSFCSFSVLPFGL